MKQAPSSVAQLDFVPAGPVTPSPADWRDVLFYQLLIDRFDNADQEPPAFDAEKTPRGRDREQAAVFQGGNLRGIIRRLDYLRDLGCTGLWISPPFKNRQDDPGSYHGYAIQDFLQIDPRFGTLEDLQKLTCEAHRRGMYVILDIVINHTGDVFQYEGEASRPFNEKEVYPFGHWHKISKEEKLQRDDALWPVELQDAECFTRHGAIGDLSKASEAEILDGDFFSLKDLNLGNPKALDAMIRSFKYWIGAADIDGYRMDTVNHVRPEHMAIFCNAIHEYARRIGKMHFLIFGEVVGDDALLQKYVGRNTPMEGDHQRYPLMDATLDFPLYARLDEVLKGQKTCGELRERYEGFRGYYRDFSEASRYFVTFVDNHDQSHRPFRRFLHPNQDWKLGVLATAFILFNMGIPCIYYGSEQGFDGGGDHDAFVRECMFGGKWGAFDTTGHHFFNNKHPLYQATAKLAAIRKAYPALRSGRQYFRDISGNGDDFGCPKDGKCTLAFSRVLDTEEVLLALNLDAAEREDFVLIDGTLHALGDTLVDLYNDHAPHKAELHRDRLCVKLKLPGHGLAVLARPRPDA